MTNPRSDFHLSCHVALDVRQRHFLRRNLEKKLVAVTQYGDSTHIHGVRENDDDDDDKLKIIIIR